MFLSKIWFFIVAVVAGAAITIALVMPRPAERETAVTERKRLQTACSVVGIVLRSEARSRVQNASSLARGFGLGEVTAKASKGELISGEENAEGRAKLVEMTKELKASGIPAPSFLFLLDGKGRVVARSGVDGKAYGDVLSGYYAVDDALAGYMRDDTWIYDDKLYRVAVTPVFTNGLQRSGALVVGYAYDGPFAEKIGDDLDVDISFYAGGKAIASNHAAQVHDEMVAKYKEALAGTESQKSDCGILDPFEVQAGSTTYNSLLSRLPGEAEDAGAFYAVMIERPTAVGFSGTLDQVKKNDLSFANFPWIKLAIVFIVVVAIGIGLMVWEIDLPLRKLHADSVELAQSESKERLEENTHRGKMGSIARAVNIHIDKLGREARAAKKEFDQLIGPSTGESGNIGLPGLSQPNKPEPPPPSEFKFGGTPTAPASGNFDLGIPKPPGSGGEGLDLSSPAAATPTPTPEPKKKSRPKPPPPKPKTPPPKPPVPTAAKTPPPPQDSQSSGDEQDTVIDDSGQASEEAYFSEIFEDFVALKKRCGESTDNLTFEKFSRKLRKNRDVLIDKHGCKSVKFQVYIKDGKAALKASPVKS